MTNKNNFWMIAVFTIFAFVTFTSADLPKVYNKNNSGWYTFQGNTLTFGGKGTIVWAEKIPYIDNWKRNTKSYQSLKTVIIKEGVEALYEIPPYFAVQLNLETLEKVVFPSTFKKINTDLLRDCISLKEVVLTEGIESLEKSAFDCCKALNSITIPSSVVYIGDSAFSGCESLKSIVIPASVTEIGVQIFQDCKSLEKAEILLPLKEIPDSMFAGCKSLKEVIIPDTVKYIYHCAFYDCESLSSITLNNVESIDSSAFANCKSLSSITLPASCTSVSNQAFDGWTSDQTIILDWSSTDETTMRYFDGLNNGNNATIKYADGTPYTAIRY